MRRAWFGWSIAALVCSGCGSGERITVPLQRTQPNTTLSGTASVAEVPQGLKISAHITGAPPGSHGFHIHEKGSCADGGNAAGGHYNPAQVKHGLVTKDGFSGAHAGDLGNLVVGADGHGSLEAVVPGLTLHGGQYPVAGRALILHEKPDDFGQPTGNAGGRIACGVISSPSSD